MKNALKYLKLNTLNNIVRECLDTLNNVKGLNEQELLEVTELMQDAEFEIENRYKNQ